MSYPTRKVINIVNFVRGVEPRNPTQDLVKPVVEEIRLNKQHHLPNTFLLQYDAMLRPDFQDLFHREKDDQMELGVWIEIVRPLVEAVGIEWRGRPGYDWDWYVNPGFLMAYTQQQREQLIDELMRKFKELFGEYPRSVGSWLLDSYSMDYMSRKYAIDAFAICREQFAIDAYTLWGGYFNQGYYPSKVNMLCPASTAEMQISTPVFRMLGPDPIYGYDEKAELYPQTHPSCNTLEPAWFTGHDPQAVNWMLDCHFHQECLNFAYAQLGQENSFGWDSIQKGLPMQLSLVAQMAAAGEVVVEQLGDTGRWFRRTFASTPATSLIAASDREKNGLQTVWYDCKHYRASLLLQNGRLGFRDIHLFDEHYAERYYETPCTGWQATYDNLPVVDGRLWNTPEIHAMLALEPAVQSISTARTGENELTVTALLTNGQPLRIEFRESGITIISESAHNWHFRRGQHFDTDLTVTAHALRMHHNGFDYQIPVVGALCSHGADEYTIVPQNGKIALDMEQK